VERVAWTALTAVGGGRGCRGGPCGALRCYRTRRHAVNSSRGTRGTFQTSRLCSQRGRRHVLWVVRLPSPAVFRDFRSPPPERARVPAFTTFAPSQDATREHRPGQSHPGAVQRRPVPEVPESDGGPARSTTRRSPRRRPRSLPWHLRPVAPASYGRACRCVLLRGRRHYCTSSGRREQ
jgi:hypothetical protein